MKREILVKGGLRWLNAAERRKAAQVVSTFRESQLKLFEDWQVEKRAIAPYSDEIRSDLRNRHFFTRDVRTHMEFTKAAGAVFGLENHETGGVTSPRMQGMLDLETKEKI